MKFFELKYLRAFGSFYSKIIIATGLLNVCCLSIYTAWGPSTFSGIFWLKLLSNLLIIYLFENLSEKNYYYYFNLGLSKKLLWSVTLSLDILMLITMLAVADFFA